MQLPTATLKQLLDTLISVAAELQAREVNQNHQFSPMVTGFPSEHESRATKSIHTFVLIHAGPYYILFCVST